MTSEEEKGKEIFKLALPVKAFVWRNLTCTTEHNGSQNSSPLHFRMRFIVWPCTCKQLSLKPCCPRDLTRQFSSGQNCAFMVIIKNHHYSTLLPTVTFKGKPVIRPKVLSGVLSVSYNQKQVHISLSRKLCFTSFHTIYIYWSLPYVWHKVIGVNLQWNKIHYLSYSYIMAEKKIKRVTVKRNNLKGLFMVSAMEIVLKSYRLHCSDMSSLPLVKCQLAESGV